MSSTPTPQVSSLAARATELRAAIRGHEHVVAEIKRTLRPWEVGLWVAFVSFIIAVLLFTWLPWPYNAGLAGGTLLATGVAFFLLYGRHGGDLYEAKRHRQDAFALRLELKAIEAELAAVKGQGRT